MDVTIHLDLISKLNARAGDVLYANANVLTEQCSIVRVILAFNLFIFRNHSRNSYISVSLYPNLFLPRYSVPLVDRRNLGLRVELRPEWLRTFIWSLWLTAHYRSSTLLIIIYLITKLSALQLAGGRRKLSVPDLFPSRTLQTQNIWKVAPFLLPAHFFPSWSAKVV